MSIAARAVSSRAVSSISFAGIGLATRPPYHGQRGRSARLASQSWGSAHAPAAGARGGDTIRVTSAVLTRAAHPMPTELGTLDAIHLATALLWRERTGAAIVMATHDVALATAARASGLPVVGV
jgi:hypothetical protein